MIPSVFHSPLRLFLAIAMIGCLSGCGGIDGYGGLSKHIPTAEETRASNAERKQREDEAWAKVAKDAPKSCPTTTNPPARAEAVSNTDCVTTLINRVVMPVALYPDLLRDNRDRARTLAQSYAAGQMTAAQYKAASIARLQDYKAQWNARTDNQTLSNAQKLWQGDRVAAVPTQRPAKHTRVASNN